ncbi:MAG: SRPBCC family protein, partial [Nakamurella sp.]
MTINPSGRIQQTPAGIDILVTRLIRGTIDDVWASVTESDRTARWFGRWEGDGAPGGMIRLQLNFEEGKPWSDVRIDSCEPPTALRLTVTDDSGGWLLDVTLVALGERTELTLTQHRSDTDGAGEIGPGWEYYLDNLIASRENTPLPDFNDYYPSLKAHYEGLADPAG